MTKNRIGVYLITNNHNKKQYVGSSKNVNYRMQRHRSQLKGGFHKNRKLQAAYNKYGLDGFTFSVVELVNDLTDLLTREQYYIDTLKPFYNIMQVAGTVEGFKHSLETIEKCIAANKRRTGTHHTGQKGRVFKLDKDTLEILDVYSSGGAAAESLKSILKGTVETAANKIGESVKRGATAYGYRWLYEKLLDRIKVDELLETLAKKQAISSQAIDTSIEGSETT